MRIAAAVVFAVVIATHASAGTLTPGTDATMSSYSFSGCTRPAEPDLAIDVSLKGREAIRAKNEKVKVYNAHVEAVNAYMVCLSEEAGRDLQLYYQAVQSSLDAEQNSVLEALSAKAKELDIKVRN